jgi:hypothetical protein
MREHLQDSSRGFLLRGLNFSTEYWLRLAILDVSNTTGDSESAVADELRVRVPSCGQLTAQSQFCGSAER